jgi:hypothetical protein
VIINRNNAEFAVLASPDSTEAEVDLSRQSCIHWGPEWDREPIVSCSLPTIMDHFMRSRRRWGIIVSSGHAIRRREFFDGAIDRDHDIAGESVFSNGSEITRIKGRAWAINLKTMMARCGMMTIKGDEICLNGKHSVMTFSQGSAAALDAAVAERSNGIFLFNTEYLIHPLNPHTAPRPVAAGPAAGFKLMWMLARSMGRYRRPIRIVTFDTSSAALNFRQELLSKWDGRDYPSLVRSHPVARDLAVVRESDGDIDRKWSNVLTLFGGQDRFAECWQRFRSQDHRHMDLDITADMGRRLTGELAGEPAIIWTSNIWSAFYNLQGRNRRQLWRDYRAWKSLLPRGTVLAGHDPDGRNLPFEPAGMEQWVYDDPTWVSPSEPLHMHTPSMESIRMFADAHRPPELHGKVDCVMVDVDPLKLLERPVPDGQDFIILRDTDEVNMEAVITFLGFDLVFKQRETPYLIAARRRT